MTAAGAAVRLAARGDYGACARLFLELRVPDPVFSTEIWETMMLPSVVVAEPEGGGDVVGYALWRMYGDVAHVMHVAVAPEARGHGVGRALVEAVRAELSGVASRWYLNVKQDNAPAIRLYERVGFAVEVESTSFWMPWERLRELPLEIGVGSRPATADEDAGVAAALGLAEERVRFSRERPGYLCDVLVTGSGAILGFSAFDPSYNGAYPFAVARPALARALLDALRPHARPEHDGVNIAVEDDRALADTFRAAGARVNFELYRMGAALA
ncbi:MAG: GNAT family N-acetyltransferase [Myxococcales bacterium]|nr:GNAT family N-acetyltransferase [Myxococcales bacterium]